PLKETVSSTVRNPKFSQRGEKAKVNPGRHRRENTAPREGETQIPFSAGTGSTTERNSEVAPKREAWAPTWRPRAPSQGNQADRIRTGYELTVSACAADTL